MTAILNPRSRRRTMYHHTHSSFSSRKFHLRGDTVSYCGDPRRGNLVQCLLHTRVIFMQVSFSAEPTWVSTERRKPLQSLIHHNTVTFETGHFISSPHPQFRCRNSVWILILENHTVSALFLRVYFWQSVPSVFDLWFWSLANSIQNWHMRRVSPGVFHFGFVQNCSQDKKATHQCSLGCGDA